MRDGSDGRAHDVAEFPAASRAHTRAPVHYFADAEAVIGGLETAMIELTIRLSREHYARERELPELVDIGGEA